MFHALNPFIHRGFRIHLFHLLSPEEMDLGDNTLSRYEDLETREQLTLHPKAIAESYRETLHTHITRSAHTRGAATGGLSPRPDRWLVLAAV